MLSDILNNSLIQIILIIILSFYIYKLTRESYNTPKKIDGVSKVL